MAPDFHPVLYDRWDRNIGIRERCQGIWGTSGEFHVGHLAFETVMTIEIRNLEYKMRSEEGTQIK